MWKQTLDGQDVFDQGDGWVFYGKSQQWFLEPNLLMMPTPPTTYTRISAKVDREKKALSGDWPSLRSAWSLRTSQSISIGHLLMRLVPLWTAIYVGWHIPLFIRVMQTPEGGDNPYYGEHQFVVAIGLSVLSAFCLWIIWADHVAATDKKKGQAITAAVFGAVGTIEIVRWLRKVAK